VLYVKFPSVKVGLFIDQSDDLLFQDEILLPSEGLFHEFPSPSTSVASSQIFGERSSGLNSQAAYALGVEK